MNSRFDWWCKTAAAQVRYGPDWESVYNELYAHLEDLYDAAIDRGLTADEATEYALKSMGSAAEIAPQLGAIHRPWLGWLVELTRWGIYGLCAVLALQLFVFLRYNAPSQSRTPWYYENPGEPLTVYAEDSTWESRRLLDYDPDSRDTSDGFTFDVSRAVMSFHDHYTDDDQDAYYFQCRVKVTGLFQWSEIRDIPIHDFWAVDSLGNVYSSFKNDAYSYQRSVSGNLEWTGYFSCTMDLWLNNFSSQAAQWIELRYDRDGRDIRLRIDLNGGESA